MANDNIISIRSRAVPKRVAMKAIEEPTGSGVLAATRHALKHPVLIQVLRPHLSDIERIDALAQADLQAVRISDRVLSMLSLAWLEPGDDQLEALRRALSQLRVFMFLRNYVDIESVPRRIPGEPDLRLWLGNVAIDLDIHVPAQRHSLWQGTSPSGNPVVRILDTTHCFPVAAIGETRNASRYAAQFALNGSPSQGFRLRPLQAGPGVGGDLLQSLSAAAMLGSGHALATAR